MDDFSPSLVPDSLVSQMMNLKVGENVSRVTILRDGDVHSDATRAARVAWTQIITPAIARVRKRAPARSFKIHSTVAFTTHHNVLVTVAVERVS